MTMSPAVPTSASDALQAIRLSEDVVPARPPATLPAFAKRRLPSRGGNVLLIVPTDNQYKKGVIKEYVESHAPAGAQVLTETVPVDSGVGEQPYNGAGALGAFNRITSALEELSRGGRLAAMMEKHSIGTVIVGAIESFIQTADVARPADHAVAVIHNASSGKTATACSRGATLDPDYIRRAAAFGYVHDDPDHGRETVGNVLAGCFPGLDPKDWHLVLVGVSRYTLLREALANLSLAWR